MREWIADAHAVLGLAAEPVKSTGRHCDDPFPCGFLQYCQRREHPVEYPVAWLPNIRTKASKSHIAGHGITDLREVPDKLLNTAQQRVKAHTLSGEPYFDAEQAAAALARHPLPAFFLDFETISFAVPIWKGTRPYQPLTFQFSVHRLSESRQARAPGLLGSVGRGSARGAGGILDRGVREAWPGVCILVVRERLASANSRSSFSG